MTILYAALANVKEEGPTTEPHAKLAAGTSRQSHRHPPTSSPPRQVRTIQGPRTESPEPTPTSPRDVLGDPLTESSRVLEARRLAGEPSINWRIIPATQSDIAGDEEDTIPTAPASPTTDCSIAANASDAVASIDGEMTIAPLTPTSLCRSRASENSEEFFYPQAQPRDLPSDSWTQNEVNSLRAPEPTQEKQPTPAPQEKSPSPVPVAQRAPLSEEFLTQEVDYLNAQLKERDVEIAILRERLAKMEAAMEKNKQEVTTEIKEAREYCERADEQFKLMLGKGNEAILEEWRRSLQASGSTIIVGHGQEESEELYIVPGGNKWPEDIRHRFSMASMSSEGSHDEISQQSQSPLRVAERRARVIEKRLSKMERETWDLHLKASAVERDIDDDEARPETKKLVETIRERRELWQKYGVLETNGEEKDKVELEGTSQQANAIPCVMGNDEDEEKGDVGGLLAGVASSSS